MLPTTVWKAKKDSLDRGRKSVLDVMGPGAIAAAMLQVSNEIDKVIDGVVRSRSNMGGRYTKASARGESNNEACSCGFSQDGVDTHRRYLIAATALAKQDDYDQMKADTVNMWVEKYGSLDEDDNNASSSRKRKRTIASEETAVPDFDILPPGLGLGEVDIEGAVPV